MKKLTLFSIILFAGCSEPKQEVTKPDNHYLDSCTHYADSLKWDLYDFQDSINQAEIEKIIKERKDALSN